MNQKSSKNNNGKGIPIKAIAWIFILFFIILIVGFMIIPAYFDKTPFGKLFLNTSAPWALTAEEKNKFNYSDKQLSGRNLYLEYCASCHGPIGKGDGPLSVTLRKRPPNFIDPSSRFINGFNKIKLLETIEKSIPNSEMPQFNYLPKETKENIIEYLLHMHENANLY
ncbi:c-type cytochrome [Fluviispira multicolorata]|uniref:C-type cytochrome n=1 Tax=Fluviispira multicolorata TaxID=2654512 RepID=A0A833N5F0_9BACT|nr:cytochrome c [Fluviispira multicolorata]KAB8030682.1 c-type cytochrome [Fluviispira multicolorata]